MGLEVASETSSNLGRIDLLVQVAGTMHIIGQSPEEGVQQIKERQYYLPYLYQGQKLAIVGISISYKDRNMASWAGMLPDG